MPTSMPTPTPTPVSVVVVWRDGHTLSGYASLPLTSHTIVCEVCGTLCGSVESSPRLEFVPRLLSRGFCPLCGPDYGVLMSADLWSLPLHILREEFLRLMATADEAPWADKLPEYINPAYFPRVENWPYFTTHSRKVQPLPTSVAERTAA